MNRTEEIKRLEAKLRNMRECFERCDNQRSVEGQREYDAIRKLETKIRELKGGISTFGLGK